MESTGKFLILAVVCLLPCVISGETCAQPTVKSDYYTTTEAVASIDTVFVVEFSLSCKNNLRDINLYAEVGGKTIPVTKTDKDDHYQVSLSDEHKKLPAGTYNIRLFDEEGYATLRKAQRSGDNLDNVKPLSTITVSHPGVWKGPYVQSEFVAALVAIFVWYMAYTAKSKLQTSN